MGVMYVETERFMDLAAAAVSAQPCGPDTKGVALQALCEEVSDWLDRARVDARLGRQWALAEMCGAVSELLEVVGPRVGALDDALKEANEAEDALVKARARIEELEQAEQEARWQRDDLQAEVDALRRVAA